MTDRQSEFKPPAQLQHISHTASAPSLPSSQAPGGSDGVGGHGHGHGPPSASNPALATSAKAMDTEAPVCEVYQVGAPLVRQIRLPVPFLVLFTVLSSVGSLWVLRRQVEGDDVGGARGTDGDGTGSGAAHVHRFTDGERALMTSLAVLVLSALEAVLTRPVIAVHSLSCGLYIEMLPWSLMYVLSVLFGDQLLCHLSDRTTLIMPSYGVAAGFVVGLLFFSYRCPSWLKLGFYSMVAVVMWGWLLIGHTPGQWTTVLYSLMWVVCLRLWLQWVPTPVAGTPNLIDDDTFGFANVVLSAFIALAIIVFILPDNTAITLGDLYDHVVTSGWTFCLAFWARGRLQSLFIAFLHRSSPTATFNTYMLSLQLTYVSLYLVGLLGPSLPSPAAWDAVASEKTETLVQTVLTVVAATLALRVLYRNARAKMGVYADESKVPFYVLSLTSLVDYVRLMLAGYTWIVFRLIGYVLNLVAPQGIQFFMSHGPVSDDPAMLTGTAHFVAPRESFTKDGVRPQYFVFNAGTMLGKAAVKDWVKTAQSTANMVRQFANDPEFGGDATGFSGNLVADFPVYYKNAACRPCSLIIPDGYRQFNMSGWSGPQAAMSWYARAKPHKDIVSAYHGKNLETFTAMLSSLQPARPIVYQNRCTNCYTPVSGYPDVDTCPECGTDLPPMPLF